MEVLHFVKTSWPDSMGGMEQVVRQIVRGTAQLGIRSNVLALSKTETSTTETEGYAVHRVRADFEIASTPVSAAALSRFVELAATADVINYHFPWPFMDVVHFVTRVHRPTLVTYHSDILRHRHLLKLYRPLQRAFMRSVDRIVVTSPNYVATSEVVKAHSDKVVVIPIGLDRGLYSEPPAEVVKRWRDSFGNRFFLFVGVFRYYKGLRVLLDAAAGADFPVVVVGAGPTEGELKAQARRLRLTNVHFLGALPDDDKNALLSLCHAVVLPSHLRSEAFGVSLLEGAMYAKPLISCEIGTGTSFVNIDGETGLVVPPSDSTALRAAMDALWQSPERAQQMGARALVRYRTHFTARNMAAAYAALYGELVETARRM